MLKIKQFFKKEAVLVISFILAAISAFFVHPNKDYLSYIDFRTLALQFCLMTIMAGLNSLGIFSTIAEKLIGRVGTSRSLCLVLVLLCFFFSMLITNDVALITLVPFTAILLKLTDKTDKLIFVITLETIAANLGSMLTPIGNPQNLFLFSAYEMTMGDFLKTMLPYSVLSLVLLVICSLFGGKEKISLKNNASEGIKSKSMTVFYSALFVLALLCILRFVHFGIVLAAVLLLVLVFDRKTLLKVDYSLLLTFVFLFVFIGNLGNIPKLHSLLQSVITGNELIAGVVSSQVISNVPAAILLSGFTDNITPLLIGVNLGGLGTLIASMASLISFKLVQKEKVSSAKYLLFFSVMNVVFLAFELVLYFVLH